MDEGFAFLRDVDPVFVLRFDDESTIAAILHRLMKTGGSP